MSHGKKVDLEAHPHWAFVLGGCALAFFLGFLILNNHNKVGNSIAWFCYITGAVVAIIACVMRMAQQRKFHQRARITAYLIMLVAIVILAVVGVVVVLF